MLERSRAIALLVLRILAYAASGSLLLVAVGLFLAWRRPGSLRGVPAPRKRETPGQLVEAILKAAPPASRAWPGYAPLDQPLLLTLGSAGSIVLGAPPPPRGFSRAAWSAGPVWVSSRAFQPGFNYLDGFDVDGATLTALRVEEPLDVDFDTRYFLHEHFHDAQEKRLFRNVPRQPYLVEDPADIALAGLEGQRLADWVERGDEDALRDFAAARARRRRLFPGSRAELWEERVEGTAKFVELAGMEALGPRRDLLIGSLREPPTLYAMRMNRDYGIGAALCRWLDGQKAPGWRESVQKGRAPSELALERLALDDAEVARRLSVLTAAAGYAEAERAARRDIDSTRAQRADVLRQYDALEGRRLVLSGRAARAGFSGNWFEYPDGSSLLLAAEWSVDKPGIRVQLNDKAVRRRRDEAEFVVYPKDAVTLDGRRWTPAPGRVSFRTLTISEPEHVELTAGPGVLEDDGRRLRLVLAGPDR